MCFSHFIIFSVSEASPEFSNVLDGDARDVTRRSNPVKVGVVGGTTRNLSKWTSEP